MSLERFLGSLIDPVGLLEPAVLGPGQVGLSVEEEQRARRNWDLWLTPQTVAAFEPADFDFLSKDQLRSLSGHVDRFRQLVAKVPASDVPPPQTIDAAWQELRAIVEEVVLFYNSTEALKVGKQVEAALEGGVPPWVVALRFETGLDHDGDPVLRVRVFADESLEQSSDFSGQYTPFFDTLRDRIDELGTEYYPLIRLTPAYEEAGAEG